VTHLVNSASSGVTSLVAPLIGWLVDATRSLPRKPPEEYLFVGDTPPKGNLCLRIMIGSAANAENQDPRLPLDWHSDTEWPFVLCPADRGPADLTSVLIWPAGTFPSRADSEDHGYLPYPVRLCYLGRGTPPKVGKGQLKGLSEIISSSCLYGPTGISLKWPGFPACPLDTIPPSGMDDILSQWGILPKSLPDSLPASGWSPAFSGAHPDCRSP